jgi:hypothetical protein
MKLNVFVALFFILSLHVVNAQSFVVKGLLIDDTGSPLTNANVGLLKPKDSILLKGTMSNTSGWYEIQGIKPGFYLLKYEAFGYETFYMKVKVDDMDLLMEKVVLQPEAKLLQGTKAKGNAAPVTQKGDTSEYKSSAFKTNPDANAEDLVNKMPGVTNTSGKLQVQGEDVKTVLVDGKPFFWRRSSCRA